MKRTTELLVVLALVLMAALAAVGAASLVALVEMERRSSTWFQPSTGNP
jgi:hypothetical protein